MMLWVDIYLSDIVIQNCFISTASLKKTTQVQFLENLRWSDKFTENFEFSTFFQKSVHKSFVLEALDTYFMKKNCISMLVYECSQESLIFVI